MVIPFMLVDNGELASDPLSEKAKSSCGKMHRFKFTGLDHLLAFDPRIGIFAAALKKVT